MTVYLVVIIIAVALIFDFLNGFNDAANSIATIVATKVLSPFRAVLWAAFFNFIAAFGLEVHVAHTIAKGIVDIEVIRQMFPSAATPADVQLFLSMIALAGLCGAIVWNVIVWYFGLPISVSHSLIGGFVGATYAAVYLQFDVTGGFLQWMKIRQIALFIVLAPMMGLAVGFLNMVAVMWLFRRAAPRKIDSWFRRLQLLSAAAYSLGHGTNDAQKTMGIIMFLLIGAGYLSVDAHTPAWVILSCHAAIALSTMAGGWRIVRTMGLSITKLRPVGGFCAETAGAVTILGASWLGIPVSTTHTITGAIVGVGATTRLSAVKWGVAGRIVWAWVLTMPLSAVMAAGVYALIHFFQ